MWKEGLWSVTSKFDVVSTDAETHLAWLLDRLEPHRDELHAYIESHQAVTDITSFWESATGNGGPMFSPEILARLASFGFPYGLDIYFLDE